MKQQIAKIKSILLKIAAIAILTAMLPSCAYNHVAENNNQINLIWHNTPATQSVQEFKTGIAWLFSYLGANLPKGDFEKGVKLNGNKVDIQLDQLGFSTQAKIAISQLIHKLKASKEYEQNDAIDAGRFFALCFNSSWHYYAITEAPVSYTAFKNRFLALSNKQFKLDSSSVAANARLLAYSIDSVNAMNQFFTAEEGSGHFSSANFNSSGTIEAFDFMENGQPRFVIYGSDGKLKESTELAFSNAGKPSKCMWCHESKIQPLFRTSPDLPGSVTSSEFETDVAAKNLLLQSYRNGLNSSVQFSNLQDHTQAELIYLSFFEPNASRLAMEWGLSESEVETRLASIPTHSNAEFAFFDKVYFRHQVEDFAPFQVVKVCTDSREPEGFEPDYLK